MRAMDQGHAGAPCTRERFGPRVKAVACSAPACKLQPRVAFPGAAASPVHPSGRSATGRTPLRAAVEPSFFTPQAVVDIGAPETEREIEVAPVEEPVPAPLPVEQPVEEPAPA
jgi:hypothetical protein